MNVICLSSKVNGKLSSDLKIVLYIDRFNFKIQTLNCHKLLKVSCVLFNSDIGFSFILYGFSLDFLSKFTGELLNLLCS